MFRKGDRVIFVGNADAHLKYVGKNAVVTIPPFPRAVPPDSMLICFDDGKHLVVSEKKCKPLAPSE